MELVVYGGLCPAGEERKLAYRLLALALEREAGLTETPALEREAGGKPFFPGFPQLQFNLSHSRGAAVCAGHRQAGGPGHCRPAGAPGAGQALSVPGRFSARLDRHPLSHGAGPGPDRAR